MCPNAIGEYGHEGHQSKHEGLGSDRHVFSRISSLVLSHFANMEHNMINLSFLIKKSFRLGKHELAVELGTINVDDVLSLLTNTFRPNSLQ